MVIIDGERPSNSAEEFVVREHHVIREIATMAVHTSIGDYGCVIGDADIAKCLLNTTHWHVCLFVACFIIHGFIIEMWIPFLLQNVGFVTLLFWILDAETLAVRWTPAANLVAAKRAWISKPQLGIQGDPARQGCENRPKKIKRCGALPVGQKFQFLKFWPTLNGSLRFSMKTGKASV